jgi:hypothetical protein
MQLLLFGDISLFLVHMHFCARNMFLNELLHECRQCICATTFLGVNLMDLAQPKRSF